MKIIKYAQEQSKWYKTNNVLLMWGDDFSHVFANTTYAVMDKIIEDINQTIASQNKLNITVEYSSMKRFFENVY